MKTKRLLICVIFNNKKQANKKRTLDNTSKSFK